MRTFTVEKSPEKLLAALNSRHQIDDTRGYDVACGCGDVWDRIKVEGMTHAQTLIENGLLSCDSCGNTLHYKKKKETPTDKYIA